MKCASAALGAAALAASVVLLPSAASAADASGSGEAIIVTPTAFFLVEDMSFGTIVPGSSAGTVTIDAVSGTRSSGGGIVTLAGSGERARFVAGGSDGQAVDLTLGPLPTLDDGNGNTMPVTSLVLDGPTTRTFGPSMAMDIYVGGTLSVGANQVPGLYSGTFTLTIEYS